MKLFQKIIFSGILVISATYLIFVLGFSSNIALGSVRVESLYIEMQAANHQLFKIAIWLVVLTGVSFILGNHKNVNYFIGNFVTSISATLFSLYVSVFSLMTILPIRQHYIEAMDIESDSILVLFALNYGNNKTFFFDALIIISTLLIIFALMSSYIIIRKYNLKVKSAKVKKQRMEVLS
jgi:hypothetical protein